VAQFPQTTLAKDSHEAAVEGPQTDGAVDTGRQHEPADSACVSLVKTYQVNVKVKQYKRLLLEAIIIKYAAA